MMTELKCPNCGNDGKGNRSIQHVEWVPTYRRVEGMKMHPKAKSTPVFFLDYDDYYNATEDAKDAVFYCSECETEWAIPRKSFLSDASTLPKSERLSTTLSMVKEEKEGA